MREEDMGGIKKGQGRNWGKKKKEQDIDGKYNIGGSLV